MKATLAACLAVLAWWPAVGCAQAVPGNEALRLLAGGQRQVLLPPLPARALRPCAADAGCHAGAWLMVETPEDLRECTEAYARRGTCRASSHGVVPRLRLWVVHSGGQWQQCQWPSLASRCTPLFGRPPANLPYPAVQ